MAISIIDQFKVNAPKPIDDRFQIATFSDVATIDKTNWYKGMIIHIVDTGFNFYVDSSNNLKSLGLHIVFPSTQTVEYLILNGLNAGDLVVDAETNTNCVIVEKEGSYTIEPIALKSDIEALPTHFYTFESYSDYESANKTNWPCGSIACISDGITADYLIYNENQIATADMIPSQVISQLACVTENATGFRLASELPENHGPIGQNALDLSISDAPSATKGATGLESIALGKNTTASGNQSIATGFVTKSSGFASIAQGSYTIAAAYGSYAGGYIATSGLSTVSGAVAFAHQKVTGAIQKDVAGECSAVLGGINNRTTVGGFNSVILGGSENAALHERTVILGCANRTSFANGWTLVENLKSFGAVESDSIVKANVFALNSYTEVDKPVIMVNDADFGGHTSDETVEPYYAFVSDLNALRQEVEQLRLLNESLINALLASGIIQVNPI